MADEVSGAKRGSVASRWGPTDEDLGAGRQRRAGDGRTRRRRGAVDEGRGDRPPPGHLAEVPARHPARPQAVRARAVQRGPDGGFALARPASEISLADIFRAIDGPLADVHDESLRDLEYPAPAEALPRVWMAIRGSLRSVLETVTVADLVAGDLPPDVVALADTYQRTTEARYGD